MKQEVSPLTWPKVSCPKCGRRRWILRERVGREYHYVCTTTTCGKQWKGATQ